MKDTLLYVRVSTDEQARGGHSLATQESVLLAAYPGGHIVRDEGMSGADTARPGLSLCAKHLSQGGTVVVTKLDRLYRDAMLGAWLHHTANIHGGRLISLAGEGTASDSPTDILMRQIIGAFGEFERRMIGHRTQVVLAHRARGGHKIGGSVPYGYMVVGEGDTRRIEPNHLQSHILTQIHRMAGDGMRARAIHTRLIDAGNCGVPAPSTIAGMLKRGNVPYRACDPELKPIRRKKPGIERLFTP